MSRSQVFGPGHFLALLALCLWAARLSAQTTPDYIFDQNVYVQLETGSHHCPVASLAFAPDGTAVSVSTDKTIRFWDAKDGHLLKCQRGWIGFGLEGALFTVAVHPDGTRFAVAGWYQGRDFGTWNSGTIRIFRRQTPITLESLSELGMDAIQLLDKTLVGHSVQVMCLRYSPDGRFLVSGDDSGKIKLWDANGKDLNRFSRMPSAGISEMDYSPDGQKIAVVAADGSLYLYGVESGDILAMRKSADGDAARSVMFQGDSSALLVGTTTGKALLLDGSNLAPFRIVADLHAAVPVLARFRTDKRIAFTGLAETTSDGQLAYPVMETSLEGGQTKRIAEFDKPVHDLVVSREKHTLAVLRKGAASFSLLDPAGKVMACGNDGTPVQSVAWTEGGKGIVVNGGQWRFRLDQRQYSADGAKGAISPAAALPEGITSKVEKGSTVFRYRGKPIWLTIGWVPTTAAVSPNGKLVAVAANNGSIYLLDAEGLDVRKIFIGSEGLVRSLAFSPDSRLLVSGSSDQVVRFWDATGGTALVARNYIELMGISGLWGSLSKMAAYYDDLDIHGAAGLLELYKNLRRYAPESNVAFLLDPPDVNPLLSLHATAEGEWALWTPDGYYDCSLEGARLIGWHSNIDSLSFLNHHPRCVGSWFPLEQFSALYYRPNVIEKALRNELSPTAPILNGGYTPPDLFYMKVNGKEYEDDTIEIMTEKPEFSLFFLVNSQAPLRQPELFYNGRVINQGRFKGPPQVSLSQEGTHLEANYSFTVNNRDNWYRVYTPDERGCTSASRTIHIIYTGPNASPAFYKLGEKVAKPKSNGTLYVLAAGVNHYTNPGMAAAGMGDLAYAEKDATDMATLWAGQQGKLFDKVETSVLTKASLGRDVTQADIMRAFAVLGTKATHDTDSVLVFLSGHGLRKDDGFYYLSSEADPTSKQSLDATSPSWIGIGDKLKSLTRAKEIVVLVDACHSGAINPTELGFTWKNKGVVLITSSRAGQKSYEGGSYLDDRKQKSVFENGLFTQAILEGFGRVAAGQGSGMAGAAAPSLAQPSAYALADTSQDHVLIVGEVLDYATRMVGQWSNGLQTPWAPAYDPAIEGKVLGVTD